MTGSTIQIHQASTTDEVAADLEELCARLATHNYLKLRGDETQMVLSSLDDRALDDWSRFEQSWDRLPVDTYMADGGTYRRRRYMTLVAPASSADLTVVQDAPHYQAVLYNELNGGTPRYFEPIEDVILSGNTMFAILTLGCELFGRLAPYSNWHIEVHQFRIEANGRSVGKPTPEGTHRDGVDYAMMVMVRKEGVTGGRTSLYDPLGRQLDEFTSTEPLDLAIVNDERLRHGVTPIAPLRAGQPGFRDILVATFRHTTAGELSESRRHFGKLISTSVAALMHRAASRRTCQRFVQC